MVSCPICGKTVKQSNINEHIDSNCTTAIEPDVAVSTSASTQPFFKTPITKRETFFPSTQPVKSSVASPDTPNKRSFEEVEPDQTSFIKDEKTPTNGSGPATKKSKISALERAAPLAERMRPKSLDEVQGQDIVGQSGVLRSLIDTDRVPSMILWGYSGTGKTTIARLIASHVQSRFIEINSTSTGVGELKKLFNEARSELSLTGRKTIIFCDEIHRFSKSQQDVFLGPVEAGHMTLIGATTENPSFKVQSALLSRCRVFTLSKLTDDDITSILHRTLSSIRSSAVEDQPGPLIDESLLRYLAQFADGDARTALNLLELALSLSHNADTTIDELKQQLTKTLVYDRAGDQHYDTISAFHKCVRGSSADGALYYLARMIASGEDALYIARRMIVIASEDVGLADSSMLSLATATYSACEKIGLPECRINLAHCTVALCLAPKSTRAYRAFKEAESAVREPGVAGLPIPIHLKNAPTRLMKELGYGKEYKYNPAYKNGRVKQEYLPDGLIGRMFLDEHDFGDEEDPDLSSEEGEKDGNEKQIEQNGVEVEGVTLEHDDENLQDTQMSSQTVPPEDWQ